MSTAENNSENASASPPIDLTHLNRITLGDADVTRDVLNLFSSHSSSYLENLQTASTQQQWREAAHKLKGSAKGIGAWDVAKYAEDLEKLSESDIDSQRAQAMEEMKRLIKNVNHYIQKQT